MEEPFEKRRKERQVTADNRNTLFNRRPGAGVDLGVGWIGDHELGQLDNADNAGDADEDSQEEDADDAYFAAEVDFQVPDNGHREGKNKDVA